MTPDSRFDSPPPKNITAREKAKAFRPVSCVENKYSEGVGDQIDWRKFCRAGKELQLKIDNGWGSGLTGDQIYEYQCVRAGLTVARALELEERAMQWPQDS